MRLSDYELTRGGKGCLVTLALTVLFPLTIGIAIAMGDVHDAAARVHDLTWMAISDFAIGFLVTCAIIAGVAAIISACILMAESGMPR